MNSSDYSMYFSAKTMMGPNSARILEELFTKYPLHLTEKDEVLDLGCGTGLTSLIIAKETGAKVYANDLWIRAEDNAKRFEQWGVGKQIIPIHEDANEFSFEQKRFDALVSIDSYHYFAGKINFFENKILPFLKNKSVVLIGIPGMKDEYSGRSEELLSEWLGDEACMFKSIRQWKKLIGNSDRIETIKVWEMDCFNIAWNEWFATNHEYANGDKKYFEAIIKPYTCFIGIYVAIK